MELALAADRPGETAKWYARDHMGFLSKLFGRSGESNVPPREMSVTEMAVMAVAMKQEDVLLDGFAKHMAIDVNDMSAGVPMLSMAIQNDLDRAALAILEQKPDVNLADVNFGMTALHVAIVKGKVDLVRRLLAAGADVHKTFAKPGSPGLACLVPAVKKGHVEMVRVLLEAGAKVDCDMRPDAPDPMDRGVTPLIAAACAGDLAMMRVLIKHGANVNHWPPSTMSPLMNAAFAGQTEAAKLLVESGALIELASMKFKASAYEIALQRGNKELARWLWSRSKLLQGNYPRGGEQ